VKAAWSKVSKGAGSVTLEEIANVYDPRVHPEVRSGAKQEQQMLRELMDAWDVNSDGYVS